MKYKHLEEHHNLVAPNQIVPILVDLFNPKSVLDVGCGLGTFLKSFKDHGVKKVLGIDGNWVDKGLLFKNIDSEEFLEEDLEKEIFFDSKFDLVLSLEVAEHLSQDAADDFVRSLTNAGDLIIFSAAIPFQGGYNHLNEQWIGYWEKKFKVYGYKKYDFFKEMLWDNPNVFWWYKQNMVVFSRSEMKINLRENNLTNLVHYDLFLGKSVQCKSFEDGLRGYLSPWFYLKLFLKSVLWRLGIYKIV
jgi:SAM-dependent methyltransferase